MAKSLLQSGAVQKMYGHLPDVMLTSNRLSSDAGLHACQCHMLFVLLVQAPYFDHITATIQ